MHSKTGHVDLNSNLYCTLQCGLVSIALRFYMLVEANVDHQLISPSVPNPKPAIFAVTLITLMSDQKSPVSEMSDISD